jgi:hypothetical protein
MMRGESIREGRRESVMGAWKCMGVCGCLYVYAHIWTRSDDRVCMDRGCDTSFLCGGVRIDHFFCGAGADATWRVGPRVAPRVGV